MSAEVDARPRRNLLLEAADASCYTHPVSISLRRRKDGMSRVDVFISATADQLVQEDSSGATYRAYLTDDERRKLAAVFLHDLT